MPMPTPSRSPSSSSKMKAGCVTTPSSNRKSPVLLNRESGHGRAVRADLIAAWDPASRAPPHRRLSTLLASCEGAEAVAADTLGMRNQRLLRLHRALVGGALEARVTCAHCATDS